MTILTPSQAADLFRQAPDRLLDVGAGEVALRTVGSGPDVLFVHGWPVSGATFRGLLPHLMDHVTCHVIDLPGSGSTPEILPPVRAERARGGKIEGWGPTFEQHIRTVGRVVDLLELDSVAVVGHDSGGLIARHAMVGDPRLRAMGLINTEQPHGLSWRFKMFLAARHAPGLAPALGWVCGNRRVRRNPLVFGGAFEDRSMLDGEFDEFFLQPLHDIEARRTAAVRALRSFEGQYIRDLTAIHARIDVPVQLVWGDRDPFFPIAWAEEMVDTFPDARLARIEGAGLFSHEERPAEVAAALLDVLVGS